MMVIFNSKNNSFFRINVTFFEKNDPRLPRFEFFPHINPYQCMICSTILASAWFALQNKSITSAYKRWLMDGALFEPLMPCNF